MKHLVILLFIVIFASCTGNKHAELDFSQLKEELSEQLKVLVKAIPDDKVPRSYPDDNGGYRMAGINDWTCGFPAGSFWLMYEITKDEYWKKAAVENTEKLDGVQYRTNTHDLGFMVFCSYGNEYRLTGSEDYKEVIIQASESLLTRFNPVVGCIRSWDHGSLNAANKILESLTSEEYRAKDETNGGFILKHSVGSKPASSEVDVGINYADYYYLEALKRQQNLKK